MWDTAAALKGRQAVGKQKTSEKEADGLWNLGPVGLETADSQECGRSWEGGLGPGLEGAEERGRPTVSVQALGGGRGANRPAWQER